MKSNTKNRLFAAMLLCSSPLVYADLQVVSAKVDTAPVVDGHAGDKVWERATSVVTHDIVADIDISLKTVHTDESIYFQVQFPDSSENREHKTQVWDSEKEIYHIGPRREDTFVIKWNMEPYPVDITLSGDESYKADIWYWKSFRTDHAGFADDKFQLYSDHPSPKAQRLVSNEGKTFYLTRKGDQGTAAYRNRVVTEFSGDNYASYERVTPTGSRADVRAKGQWHDGVWTVEYSRKLNTGNVDDVLLLPGQQYRFGVSRYEIAGRESNPEIENPLFGAGEISTHLQLVLE